MDTQGAAPALQQHFEIALGRCVDHPPETVGLSRHIHVARVITRDLDKQACVRTTLIGLASGVQKARSDFRAGCKMLPVADFAPDSLE